jgi:hypothetical protein
LRKDKRKGEDGREDVGQEQQKNTANKEKRTQTDS